MPTIGHNLKRARIAAGFTTQCDFALVCGLPQPRISDLERERVKGADVWTLLRLAKALRVSVDVLLEGVDPEYDLYRHSADALLEERAGLRTVLQTTAATYATLRATLEHLHATIHHMHHTIDVNEKTTSVAVQRAGTLLVFSSESALQAGKPRALISSCEEPGERLAVLDDDDEPVAS